MCKITRGEKLNEDLKNQMLVLSRVKGNEKKFVRDYAILYI